MAVEELVLEIGDKTEMPDDVRALIVESDRRIDAFFHAGKQKRYPKYIPSDPELIHAGLRSLTEREIPMGEVFCEWGSGFGVATCIASLLGYEAHGVELREALVEIAESLAADTGIAANYYCASYLPEGLESYEGMGGEELIESRDTLFGDDGDCHGHAYEGMGRPLEEVDVFFGYPWPLEQEFMLNLFDAVAVEGAVFLAYHGRNDIRAFRKIGEDD